MSTPAERIRRAFAHQEPDRTPLFELFNPHHPIHWGICGHTVATDAGLAWDAMADGIDGNELFEASIRTQYAVNRYFGLDMVRFYGAPRHYTRPVKVAHHRWTLDGVAYHYDPRTDLVVLENPAAESSYSHRYSEAALRQQIESWDGRAPAVPAQDDPVIAAIRPLAQRDGVEWVYMGEIGAGTGVAFYPPFMLMWMLEEPDLLRRWIDMQKASALSLIHI